MQTAETLNEGLKRAYKLTIPAKDIATRVDEQLNAVAPQVRMPGFRPGKVPANLVRKMHGEALEREALEKAVQDGVQQLLTEQNLRPAMQPSVELDGDYESGKDVAFSVELEILPQIDAPQLEGLKLERLIVDVSDAEVDAAVDRLASQQKSFDDAPEGHAAEEGDLVVMDFEGKVDGEPFEGGKGEGMSIEIGSGRLIPGFEDQLVGVKVNDSKVLNVNFPEDYNVDYLKGKPATFDVTITSVRRPREAKADEDFAKSLGLDSLEKLREILKSQVEQELNNLTRTHLKRKLLDQLAASHDFDVPPSMVEAEFQQIWQQLQHEAGHEEDPEAARAQLEAERDDYHAIAVRRVRLGLLLSEIGQANGVQITQAEMNRLIAQAAQQYGPQDRERFLQYIQQTPMAQAQLRAPLYEEKVVDFLLEKAEITDRTVSREELETAIEADDEGHVHGPDCDHDHDHAPAKAKKPAKAKTADAKTADAKTEKGKAEKAGADEVKAEAKPRKKKAEAAEGAEAEKPAKKPARKKAASSEA